MDLSHYNMTKPSIHLLENETFVDLLYLNGAWRMILFNWIHKQCCLSLCSFYLDLPESLGAGGGCGGLPQRGPEEDVLLLLVLVTGQKLLLLGVKQPHHVSLTRGQGKKKIRFLQQIPARCRRYGFKDKVQNNTPPSARLPCSRWTSWTRQSSSWCCSWRRWPAAWSGE